MKEKLKNESIPLSNIIILAAGKSERFFNLNYKQPKPLLPLNDSDIITNIYDSFNKTNLDKITIVASENHRLFWSNHKLKDKTIFIEQTNSASETYRNACSNIKGETLIVPCDLLANHINDDFVRLKEEADAIIFTCRPTQYQIENQNKFSWVVGENDNSVKDILIKESADFDINKQMVLIGSFWIKDNKILLESIDEIINNKFNKGGEYHLDNAFKNLLNKINIKYVLCDSYFSLGTPKEYQESKYWLK